MRRILVGLILLAAASAGADDPTFRVGGLADVRDAHTDDTRSWLDGGLGKLRYGAGVNGRADLLRLSQVSLLLEVIRVESDRTIRPLLGGPLHAAETLLQLSWRTSF